MASKYLVAALLGLCLCKLSVQSSPFYSLQPAVEALSEREAQLALRNEIENGNIEDGIFDTDFMWNNEYDSPDRQKFQAPNKARARYLARTNDYDDFYPLEFKKRSMYRKRDASVFRERSRAPALQHQQQALAEKFLRAIEDEREKEEEEEYRNQLRNLWNRYQLEEGDMEKELFDNDIESDYALNNEDTRKRSRQNSGSVEVAPAYWTDKRSPMLPWLPAPRKKRFPVTKRSPKINDELITPPETKEKVSQDLQGIFGATEGDKNGVEESKKKKKRSSGDEVHPLLVENSKKDVKHTIHEHDNMQTAHMAQKRKRDVSDPDDEDEAETENDNEEEEEVGDDGGDDSNEDDSKKKKKKREATKSVEVMQSGSEKKLSTANKPFQWSNIFGLDRKKKSMGLVFHPLEGADKRQKRCESEDCDEAEDYAEEDYEDEDYRRKRKRSREEKLETMDRKLKTIENLIIEDTAKYYDSHDGSLSPSEARTLRNRVGDRLATAYSLEKMRKAIGRLRESMEFEKNLERNLLGGAHLESEEDDKKKKAKRVAVKKEKAEFNNNDHDIDSPAKKASPEPKKNDVSEGEDKKKKKRSQKKSELGNLLNEGAPMSEGYMGGRNAVDECPLLDSIEKKCRGIDIMSGDSHQNLLEACGAHQLCYLCGDSQLQCDYEYLNDAEEICGRDLKCKIAAREAVSALRSLGATKIPPRECIRNPCLNMALRSIAY